MNRGRISSSRRSRRPRPDDPRVQRTRVAVLPAARKLFLQRGYVATTMEDIAVEAGLAKRTLYNNYGDKVTLFEHVIADTVAFADSFVEGLKREFSSDISKTNVAAKLEDLGVRLALAIIRPEVVALRRMLIGESREFPLIGREYFDRAPGRVLQAIAEGFSRLAHRRVLRGCDFHSAAAQFAYLVAGEHLDRALMTGEIPAQASIEATARSGAQTFCVRYV